MLTLELRPWLSLTTLLLFLSTFFMAFCKDANAAQPSFDCSKARSWSEHEVCRNEMLAGLDVKLASLYKAKRA